MQELQRWDVICQVVDHYGDAGVCLRLARALAATPGREVRLLVDRPAVVLDLIRPPPPGDAGYGWRDRSGVRVLGWDALPGVAGAPADVVVETFGCELPPALQTPPPTGLADQRSPVWLNLEHLSAEAWVEGCHGLPSPQPGGRTRWFLFPGFTDRTAGLCGPTTPPPALPATLARWADATAPAEPPETRRPDDAPRDVARRPLTGSVFCYRESPLPDLLDAIQRGPREVRLLVPAGMPGTLGARRLDDQPGAIWQAGRLTLIRIPFLDQDIYDALLAACDFNLVRGEDSFVRAQWAARPLLWAAYRQAGAAHLDKLDAWLARCDMPLAWAALQTWFNGGVAGPAAEPAALWADALASLGDTEAWAQTWRERLLTLPRLERTLAEFAERHASPLE